MNDNPSTISATETPEVSIVISVYNEEENILPLLEEIDSVLDGWGPEFEVLVIDDGSTDGTRRALECANERFGFLRCLRFAENRGKTAGLAVGFREARGASIVTLDGDLQNDPADIPKMVAAGGADVLVCGERGRRADTLCKRLSSRVANTIRRTLLSDHATDSGCGFKVFPKESVAQIPWVCGVHRFFAAVLHSQGYTIVNVPINGRPRRFGHSKYGTWNRLKRTVPDLFGFFWLNRRRIDLNVEKL